MRNPKGLLPAGRALNPKAPQPSAPARGPKGPRPAGQALRSDCSRAPCQAGSPEGLLLAVQVLGLAPAFLKVAHLARVAAYPREAACVLGPEELPLAEHRSLLWQIGRRRRRSICGRCHSTCRLRRLNPCSPTALLRHRWVRRYRGFRRMMSTLCRHRWANFGQRWHPQFRRGWMARSRLFQTPPGAR